MKDVLTLMGVASFSDHPHDNGCHEMFVSWTWLTKSTVVTSFDGAFTIYAPSSGSAFVAKKKIYPKGEEVGLALTIAQCYCWGLSQQYKTT